MADAVWHSGEIAYLPRRESWFTRRRACIVLPACVGGCPREARSLRGKRPWTAAGEVEQAIRVRSLEEERDIPRMECPLLELRRCADPGGEENLAVLLGRLQRCDSPAALRARARVRGLDLGLTVRSERFGPHTKGHDAACSARLSVTLRPPLEEIGEWLLVCDSGDALGLGQH